MEGGSLRLVGESITSGICERLGVKFPGPTRQKQPFPAALLSSSIPSHLALVWFLVPASEDPPAF
jgi:hypothetical protein